MRIKKLALRNFKGIRAFETDFNGVTHIFGANGTGKTTLVDAYHWLFFDKDSHDRSDFNIKTLDENNESIHNLEHEVYGLIEHDGKSIELRKTYKEKWVKKRGSSDKEFSGHETEYFINDVPTKKADYAQFINSLISEDVFKLVSNPLYFASMNWKKQREMLFTIAGNLSDESIAAGNEQFENLLKDIASRSTDMEKYRVMVRTQILKMKEELEQIPARVDEVQREMPEAQDWEVIEEQIKALQSDIEKLDGSIKGRATAMQAGMDELNKLRGAINKLEIDKQTHIENQRKEANKDRDKALSEKASIQSRITQLMGQIDELRVDKKTIERNLTLRKEQVESLRQKWFSTDKQQPDIQTATECPTCHRPFDDQHIEAEREQMLKNFNNKKADELAKIAEEGKQCSALVKTLEESIAQKDAQITSLSATVDELIKQRDTFQVPDASVINIDGSFDEKIKELKEQVEKLSNAGEDDGAEVDRIARRNLQGEIDKLRSDLSKRDIIASKKQRIAELLGQEKKIAQEIASKEKIMDTIIQFTKIKINSVEEKVNSMFSIVRFKLYKQQINGGEEETCEAMVNGVPWADLNTAMKINAGMDIINTLSAYFDTSAPVWIDNRESVVQLIPTQSQVINLYVSKEDEQLRIA